MVSHPGAVVELIDQPNLPGTVTDIVYQGESLRIFLELPGGAQLSLRQPSHYAASQKIPPVGTEATVTLHPEDTIVVPKATGANERQSTQVQQTHEQQR